MFWGFLLCWSEVIISAWVASVWRGLNWMLSDLRTGCSSRKFNLQTHWRHELHILLCLKSTPIYSSLDYNWNHFSDSLISWQPDNRKQFDYQLMHSLNKSSKLFLVLSSDFWWFCSVSSATVLRFFDGRLNNTSNLLTWPWASGKLLLFSDQTINPENNL